MGVKTGIAWCDATWNPWVGCTKVSEGCANCYMFREQQRYGKDPTTLRRTSARKWKEVQSKKLVPPGSFVFVCSWSDFFHPGADKWRGEALAVMMARQDLTFLVLTKRPERMGGIVHDAVKPGLSHVWLGVTAENQEQWEERGMALCEIAWPGKKFVSVEPMLGAIDDTEEGTLHGVDWIICGGESGPGHREINLDWVRSLRDQCQSAGVRFFFKQGSGVHPEHMPMLDGKRWAERPERSK